MSWVDSLETGWGGPKEGGINTSETGNVQCPTRNLRLWLPKDSSRTIIVLDPDPDKLIAVWEHAIKMGTSKSAWRNWTTCLCHLNIDCILDVLSDNPALPCRRYKLTPLSVIDTSEFTPQRGPNAGKVVKNQKKIFPAQMPVLERWARRWKSELAVAKENEREAPRFQYSMWKVSRGAGPTSPSTGDDFTFIKNVDPEKLKAAGIDIEPFDYTELFKPDLELVKRYAQYLRSASHAEAPVHADDDGAGSNTDTLPF